MTELRFNGAVYGCEPPETVLDALTRQDLAVQFSCRIGICLPCICQPNQDLEIELPDDAAIFGRAVVRAVTPWRRPSAG